MNFRSCKYFLTVCEMGTFSAAARSLYISPQSLSEHIKKLEAELGAELFHRGTPLTLTPAGQCVRAAAQTITDALRAMEDQLAACKTAEPPPILLGLADYGIPEFLPAILEEYMACQPQTPVELRQLTPGAPVPPELSAVISARELGCPYQCELLFRDRLVVCVADSLLRKQYGADWQARKKRLAAGDLAALEGCPFIRQPHTPMEAWAAKVFESSGFTPVYLPLTGGDETAIGLCRAGQAAMVNFDRNIANTPDMPPRYRLPSLPDALPACYLGYPANRPLSAPLETLLALLRRRLKQ